MKKSPTESGKVASKTRQFPLKHSLSKTPEAPLFGKRRKADSCEDVQNLFKFPSECEALLEGDVSTPTEVKKTCTRKKRRCLFGSRTRRRKRRIKKDLIYSAGSVGQSAVKSSGSSQAGTQVSLDESLGPLESKGRTLKAKGKVYSKNSMSRSRNLERRVAENISVIVQNDTKKIAECEPSSLPPEVETKHKLFVGNPVFCTENGSKNNTTSYYGFDESCDSSDDSFTASKEYRSAANYVSKNLKFFDSHYQMFCSPVVVDRT